jgi:hypothetical protein
MMDVNQAILEAFTTTLDNSVTYNSTNVPVYCEFNPNGDDIYILLSSITTDDGSNKGCFISNCTILIDIVHKSGTSVTYDAVNDVADQVSDLIQPTPQTHSITYPPFDIVNVRRLSTQSLTLNSAGNNIMRRLLRYSLQVYE